MLNVEVKDPGEAVILYCQGQLSNENETRLICAALGNFGRDVVVDLSEVESIDAAGMGALIALQAAGVYLKLQNPGPTLRKAFFSKGMDSLFEIVETGSADTRNRAMYSCPAA